MALYLVTGPPAAGKTTWVQQNMQHGTDIAIDFDAIANTLTCTSTHQHQQHIKSLTKAVRQAAIDAALPRCADVNVYIIQATLSPQLLNSYARYNPQVITIDPGRSVVMERCKQQRPWQMKQAAAEWYDKSTVPANPEAWQPADW